MLPLLLLWLLPLPHSTASAPAATSSAAAVAASASAAAAPHAAYGPLIVNTEDPANVTIDYINVGYGLQTRGIALQDNGNGSGAAYMTSYSGSESTKKFTFDANGNESAVTSLTYTVPTDPFETARGSSLASADESVFPFIYRSYWGAVNGGNDKISSSSNSLPRVVMII